MIKFSIITVCLNAGRDLADTVESILEQDYDNYELIVKDGFSTDGSVERLPDDKHIKFIQKKDSGIYDAMNQAIDAAEGDYCIFINAGDKLYNLHILCQIAAVIGAGNAELYYGRCYNETLGVFSNSPKKLSRFFCFRSMICHQAMIFKTDIIKCRKYDLSYHVSADREMLLYLACEKKCRAEYIPLVIASYKGSGFCEAETSKKKLPMENKCAKRTYFPLFERALYNFAITLTCPRLRERIVSNPKLVKPYKKFVAKLYDN